MRRHPEGYFAAKLIIITGGTSGTGLAFADELLQRNAKVVILSDKAESVASATCVHILKTHGAPDILINNAGYAIYRTFEQEDPAEIERLMNVNFGGAVRVTKAFINGMVQRRSGHIVNVASIAGVLPLTPCALYGAAKHAMVGWSQCIAPELARFGIDVTVVCPGRVQTSFFDHESFRSRPHRKETEATVPLAAVVDATFDAILRRQRMRYIPRRYGMLAWAYHALGPLVRVPFDRLLQSRVEDLYRSSEGR